MLVSDKPKRVVSQAPIKFTTCHGGCGSQVEYRTNPRVYCGPCKVEKVKADARASMEKDRRKRGVPLAKGVVRKCADCSVVMTLERNLRAICCGPCRLERVKERSRQVSRGLKGIPGSRKKHNEWAKQKRIDSASHAINFRFRAAIRRVLNGGKRGRKWESLVDYTLSDLMTHLERQFVRGMTWGNRGSWHIDHIVPLDSFAFDSAEHDDFRAAWAMNNLRPLWARDNIRKSNTRTHLL